MIPIGKYGFCILNIILDPRLVDVNVHPAKLEVRFQEENKVFQAVYHTIKEALLKNGFSNQSDIVSSIQLENREVIKPREIISKRFKEEEKESKIESAIDGLKEMPKKQSFGIPDLVQKIGKRQEWKDEYMSLEEDPVEKGNVIADIYNTKKINLSEIQETYIDTIPEEKEIQEEKKTEQSMQEEKEEMQTPTEEQVQKKVEELTKQLGKEEQEIGVQAEEQAKRRVEEILKQAEDAVKAKEKQPEVAGKEFENMYEETFGSKPKVEEENKKKEQETAPNMFEENLSVFEKQEPYAKELYQFVGSVFSTYILIQIRNELYIMDQHAAHERIMYEKIKDSFYNNTKKDSQMMLLPDVISLSHKETEIVKENLDLFEKAGFIIEEFGENTIKLVGAPEILLELNTKQLFMDILDEIDTVARTARQEKEEKFISTIACKAAVKANMKLNKEEVDMLMAQLLKLPNPFSCPHGRPTAVKITKQELEKKFART